MFPPADPAWTTAILRVLSSLGVEEHAARQVLARAAAADWLTRERDGRAVRWRIAQRGLTLAADGIRRSNAFLSGPPSWDGRWLMLFVTVPNQRAAVRKRLHGGLSWLGMGNPTPGLWVTPHVERGDELTDLVHSLELEHSALAVVGSLHETGMGAHEVVRRAWDLTEPARYYEALLAHLDDRPEPRSGDEVLLAYLDLLSLQQHLMRVDPFLPEALLPEWVGRTGAARIRALRHRWAEPARARWAEILAESAPS